MQQGILSTPLNRNHPLAKGLVCHVPMNEGGGMKCYDSVLGKVGTLNSTGTVFAKNLLGSCISFDGSTGYASIPDVYENYIAGNQTHSFCFWIYVNSFANSPLVLYSGSNDYFFIELGSVGTTLYWGYRSGTANTRTYTLANSLATGWHMITAVKTGAGNSGDFYVDGVLQTSYTGIFDSISSTPQTLIIGKYGSPGLNFNGYMKDLKIYNRSITANEVKQLYVNPYCMYGAIKQKLSVIQQLSYSSVYVRRKLFGQSNLQKSINWSVPLSRGLVGAWPLTEGGGKAAFDATRYTIPGTLTNDAIYKKTQIGNACSFDGTTDYITFGNGGFKGLNGATSLTISAIVYPTVLANGVINAIVTRWNGQTVLNPYSMLLYNEAGSIFLEFIIYKEGNYNNGYIYRRGNFNIVTNKPFHVTATWSASKNTVELFVNGIRQTDSATVTSGSQVLFVDTDPNTSMRISTFQESAGVNKYAFNGYISNVLIWNRDLTYTEAAQLCTNPYIVYNQSNNERLFTTIYPSSVLYGNWFYFFQ